MFIDDITLYAETEDRLKELIHWEFTKLQATSMALNVAKCGIDATGIPFLGNILSTGKLCSDPKKVEAILGYPTQGLF